MKWKLILLILLCDICYDKLGITMSPITCSWYQYLESISSLLSMKWNVYPQIQLDSIQDSHPSIPVMVEWLFWRATHGDAFLLWAIDLIISKTCILARLMRACMVLQMLRCDDSRPIKTICSSTNFHNREALSFLMNHWHGKCPIIGDIGRSGYNDTHHFQDIKISVSAPTRDQHQPD